MGAGTSDPAPVGVVLADSVHEIGAGTAPNSDTAVAADDEAADDEAADNDDANDDDAGDDDHHTPVRRCFVSGDRLDKSELIRFVTGPDGVVVPDLANSLPGRGYYLRAERPILERAVAKNLFPRGARRSVTVPEGLVSMIECALQRKCLDLLGLANRSGQAVAGYEKVRKAVSEGRTAVLMTASDAGTDGLRRARSLVTAAGPKAVEINTFDGSALGGIFGRDIVVHVAVTTGKLASRLRHEGRRYAGIAFTPVGGERPG